MHPVSQIRKVFQGVADRRQIFRMFDRRAQRPNRWDADASALYAGEWFETGQADHDYMFEILPPLWMRGDMFAMRQFLTGSVTSVFFALTIDSQLRHFHGYCDISDRGSPERMRAAIVDRESRPVKAMTRTERRKHIWSATHDDYRGYAGDRWPEPARGKRTITVYGGSRGTTLKLLNDLTDEEISAKLPVHLCYLPDAIA
ncbi:DUF1419 domain-containing protein (plasmid) [Mesorhizobium sp. AR02]|uniref:DUF1419 domain-containing protein n=1 Tax=Mesorhizobium sp. AR02 TaxID=2865837 RepID=UPI00215E628A|nr:DUF1419 domain-containing protein [Mesorhizobium sp. AR02]UVK49860.1 DUF1419 domain-containing protein [Mesorhizobium sp. AR02]